MRRTSFFVAHIVSDTFVMGAGGLAAHRMSGFDGDYAGTTRPRPTPEEIAAYNAAEQERIREKRGSPPKPSEAGSQGPGGSRDALCAQIRSESEEFLQGEFISPAAIKNEGFPAEAQRSGFGGERRSSEMNEPRRKCQGEGYVAYDDEIEGVDWFEGWEDDEPDP